MPTHVGTCGPDPAEIAPPPRRDGEGDEPPHQPGHGLLCALPSQVPTRGAELTRPAADWGTSEWSAQQLQEAIAVADKLGLDPPLFDQCEYSMLQRDRLESEYLPLYPALGTTIWSPLAGGVLTGKYLNAGADGDSRCECSSSLCGFLSCWVPACGSLEPCRRDGENAQKTRKNR